MAYYNDSPSTSATTPVRHPDSFNAGELLSSVQVMLNEARGRVEFLTARMKELEEERSQLLRIADNCEGALGSGQKSVGLMRAAHLVCRIQRESRS